MPQYNTSGSQGEKKLLLASIPLTLSNQVCSVSLSSFLFPISPSYPSLPPSLSLPLPPSLSLSLSLPLSLPPSLPPSLPLSLPPFLPFSLSPSLSLSRSAQSKVTKDNSWLTSLLLWNQKPVKFVIIPSNHSLCTRGSTPLMRPGTLCVCVV